MRVNRSLRHRLAMLCAAVVVAQAACATDSTPTPAPSSAASSLDPSCAAFTVYGDLTGKAISVYTPVLHPKDQPYVDAFEEFERCTGADIQYEGAEDFETQLRAKLDADSPPDIAFIPQPGLLTWLVEHFPGQVIPVSGVALENLNAHYSPEWADYASVSGPPYAVPVSASVKSLVWYSPKAFAEHGYAVPTSWEELRTLTQQIAQDNPGIKPWCLGVEAGDVTGWPVTDWLEDVILRRSGTSVFDSWVAHRIPVDDPAVVASLDEVGTILRNDGYTTAARTAATTSVDEGGLPLLTGQCFLHRQSSSYATNWPTTASIDPQGDVYAFVLPGSSEQTPPILIGGEFAAAFADRPEVAAFQAYLASAEFSATMAANVSGGWISANTTLDSSQLSSPVDRMAFDLLTDEATTIRFDGSDQMPQAVGTGTLLVAMTEWLSGTLTSAQALGSVEKSWPSR